MKWYWNENEEKAINEIAERYLKNEHKIQHLSQIFTLKTFI
jgi:hypothetical protein